MKRIVSIWLPYLPTDRLRRAHTPETTTGEHPRALTAQDARGHRLAALDPAAAAAGLWPGMPIADARALCPGLRTAPMRPAADDRLLERLAQWCDRYAPLVAIDKSHDGGHRFGLWDHGLFIDIRGCAHLFGGEAALLSDILGRLKGFGLYARAGLADTPGAAWAAARFAGVGAMPADGFAILPEGAARQWLAPLPVAALRLVPENLDLLHRLGLKTVGQLLQLPRAGLTRRFGPDVSRRLDQALGHVDEPISPLRPPADWTAIANLPEPVATHDALKTLAAPLLDDLCTALGAAGRGMRRLRLGLYHSDGQSQTETIGASRPLADAHRLRRLLDRRIDNLVLPDRETGGIETIRLCALEVSTVSLRQNGFHDLSAPSSGDETEDRIAGFFDTITNRLGPQATFRLLPRPRHRPERAFARVAATADEPVQITETLRYRPRPFLILGRPEKLHDVTIDPGRPDAPPRGFTWRKTVYGIARAQGPERLAGDWWAQRIGPLQEATVATFNRRTATRLRDYFAVEDTCGRRFWLFRQGPPTPGAAWYLHGVFG